MPEDTPSGDPQARRLLLPVSQQSICRSSALHQNYSQPAPASPIVPAAAPSPELPLFQSRAVAPVATGGPMLSSAQALLRRDLWTKTMMASQSIVGASVKVG